MSEENGCSIFGSALAQNGKSELGLKSHWEDVFARDLSLWNQEIATENGLLTVTPSDDDGNDDECDDNDERETGGHCWFGSFVSKKMVDFVLPYCCSTEEVEEGKHQQRQLLHILDIGTGNGDLIFRLAKKLWNNGLGVDGICEVKFFGMDYCQDAIQLAKSIAQKRLVPDANVEWVVDDALNLKKLPMSSMDILLDKVSAVI